MWPGKQLLRLLSPVPDVNARTDGVDTPLHLAAWVGLKDMAELLLANGADLNLRDNEGRTAVVRAANNFQHEMVKLLRERRTYCASTRWRHGAGSPSAGRRHDR